MVTTSTTLELTEQEIRSTLDQQAMTRLGISGADLLSEYDQGKLDDPGSVGDLLVLADLLPDRSV